MRLWLPALALLAAGCQSPTEIESAHAFVRRSGPTADTIRVGRADTLRVRLVLHVQSGRARWALYGPSQREVWAGTAGDADTTATVAIAAPARGDWRLVLTPDSAIGVATVEARAR